jgi:cell division septation protein DedD
MSESNFREIQLNTKQVVFLFMACVVALLGVFLLGVQVGHGVSNDGTAAAAGAGDPANDPPVPTVLPPATSPKPGDFDAYGGLAGRGDSKATPATPPNPPADVPPETTPAAKPAATPAPKATPAAAAPSRPAATENPVSATAIWYVQTNSFSSKENADKELNQLKSKGHDAFVFTAPGGGARYKTRIGPLERNAADALKNRLSREGFRPTVIK